MLFAGQKMRLVNINLGLYAVASCFSRSKDVIEPLLKPQWYVDCKQMAAESVKVSATSFVASVIVPSVLSLHHTVLLGI